jgi:uncharacterized protein YndB with AHSA1/START domain
VLGNNDLEGFQRGLEQRGPEKEAPGAGRVPMKLATWPGGRWRHDLGNDAEHFRGNIQAIKPPTLLEVCGPLFMSSPAISNVPHRLTEENGMTRLKFTHRAMGQISPHAPIERGSDGLTARI